MALGTGVHEAERLSACINVPACQMSSGALPAVLKPSETGPYASNAAL